MSTYKLKQGSGPAATLVFEESDEDKFLAWLLEEFPPTGLPPMLTFNSRPVIELPNGQELMNPQSQRWVLNEAYRATLRAR
ncbi:hypothetical protein [Paraburkholderia sediminicola]|uniref:hypothetical protein n=1 Tax=Paraburkholderia sediminicola TaxID=458836 RepID=UPI0038BBD2B7